MIDLLMAITIVGLIATIVLPLFSQQRKMATNNQAKMAVRSALDAAKSFYNARESFGGMCVAEGTGLCTVSTSLRGQEFTLGTTEPADTDRPGPNADPKNIWLGDGVSGNDPTGGTMVMCSLSKATAIYCIRDSDGTVTYASDVGSGGSVSDLGSNPSNFTPDGWTNPVVGPCASITATYCKAILALDGTGPLIYWRLGETSGTTAKNLTGNTTYDGTYGAGGTMGVAGPGLTGDSNLAYRANATATSQVTNGSGLTIRGKTHVMWVKIDSGAGADLFSAGTTSNGWGFSVSAIDGTQGQLRVWCRSSTTYSDFFSGLTDIRYGQWFQLAVKSGATDSGVIQVWVNGVWKGSSANLVSCGDKNGSGLKLGSASGSAVTIDDYAMYNYGLDDAKVQSLYNAR